MGGRKGRKGKIPKPNVSKARRFIGKGQKGKMKGDKADATQPRVGSMGYN
jgi:hypothetical protein